MNSLSPAMALIMFSQRLNRAMQEQGLNQTDIGERMNLSSQTVQQWVSGKTKPRPYRIEAMAKILRVRPQWLLFGEGEPHDERQPELKMEQFEITEGDQPVMDGEVVVPEFREVEFSMGDGASSQVVEDNNSGRTFPIERLYKANVSPDNAALATATGESMYPTIASGSPVAIDKGATKITDGKIYALDHGGLLRLKRLYRLPNDCMRLVSDNSLEYPEETYYMKSPESPRIIGRVFWWENFD